MSDFIAEQATLFGAYIASMNVSAGYNSQSSTAQLTLVFPDDGPGNIEDYEAMFPALGSCVGVKIGELKFIGILQRYVAKKNISGYVWDVVLESPAKVLDGVQVILDTYVGNSFPGNSVVGNIIGNVWNPFGYRESYNSIGSSGTFGMSNSNTMGFPVVDLVNLMEYFGNNISTFGTPAFYGNTTYLLDLTEIKNLISNYNYLRIKGPSQSALSIIEEICSLAFSDFFIDITTSSGDFNNGLIENPIIRVKIIDRSITPDINAIKQKVIQYERDGLLISADVGKELSDTATQKLVIGAPATRYHVSRNNTQVWGKTKTPIPQYTNYIVLEDGTLYNPDILEVRCALHSFESWLFYHQIINYVKGLSEANEDGSITDEHKENTALKAYINANFQSVNNYVNQNFALQLFSDLQINKFIIDSINNGLISPHDFIDSSMSSFFQRNKNIVGEYVQENIQKIYDAIRSSGEEYYGKKYMVSLPMENGGTQNNVKFINEDAQYITSWEIADSAWNETFQYKDLSFYDNDGKMKCIAEWTYLPSVHDYTELNTNYCVNGNTIAAVSNTEKDIYFNNFANQCGSVVDIPGVKIFDQYTTERNGVFWLLYLMLRIPQDKLAAIFGVGDDIATSSIGIAPDMVTPNYIGVPQVSTRYNWGPWYGSLSPNGRSEVVFENNLSPENFGSIAAMNFAGRQYATVINSDVKGVESGYIEVAGYPENNIGERFLQSGPYVTSMDVNLDTSGYKTTYKFNTWTPQFGKTARTNLDRLSNIYKSSVRARQEFTAKAFKRTFRPQKHRDKFFRNQNISLNGLQTLAATVNGQQLNIAGGMNSKFIGPIGKNPTKSHAASLEQMFSPVATQKTKDSVQERPAFAKPKDGHGQNGKFSNNHVSPTCEDLDPFFKHENTDFKIAANGQTAEDLKDLNIKKAQERTGSKPKEFRSIGFRVPIMMSGWTYGVDGRCLPHKEDDLYQFAENASTDRNLWVTAPFDARYDEQKRVFVSGVDILEGILKTDITPASGPFSPTTFEVEICRCTDKLVGDNNDDKIKMTWEKTGEVITCVNRDSSLSVTKGEKYICIQKINYEWRPIYVECD